MVQQPLKEHLQCNKCILVHKVIHNKSPQYLRQLVRTRARNDHSSRNSILILPKTRIDIYKMSFAYSGSFCWNALPRSLKIAFSVSTFKSKGLEHFRTDCNIYVFSLKPYSIQFPNIWYTWHFMCLCISVCARPGVCVQLCFKYMDIYSLDGEVHFLSWLYTSSVLSIQNSNLNVSFLLSFQFLFIVLAVVAVVYCYHRSAVRIFIAMYVCVCGGGVCARARVCVRVCVCNMCIHVCVYTWMCVYVYIPSISFTY